MRSIIIYLFLSCSFGLSAQQTFYQDDCHCGVTGAGFSTGRGIGSGSFSIFIEPGSTIKKAFLFCHRFESAPPADVTFNGRQYNFNPSNQVSNSYTTDANLGTNAVHAIDITDDIDSSVNNYAVTIPNQNAGFGIIYGAVYLYVLYEKPSLPLTSSVIVLNDQDMDQYLTNYKISGINPMNNANDIGFATYTDRLGDTTLNDGSYIYVNNDSIGLIGGTDSVNQAWGWGGVKGHFYYQNDSLFGLDDDTPDTLMGGSDGLADIAPYIQNKDTALNLRLKWQNQGSTNQYNIYMGFFLSYTTPCDTFTTTLNTTDTTICRKDTVQLMASGGTSYKWQPASGLSCSNCPSPYASPDSSTTYRVRIWNGDSCSKVLPVSVKVNPLPEPQITTTSATCGKADGTVVMDGITTNSAPYNFSLDSLNNTTGSFSGLGTGNYPLSVTDSKGCTWQGSVLLKDTIITQAAFTADPQKGKVPLEVFFNNESQNATGYTWVIAGDTLEVFEPAQYLFDSAGSYAITLIAYDEQKSCSDTAKLNIIAEDSSYVILPNVFSPNGDGTNEQLIATAGSISAYTVKVYNRWGSMVFEKEIPMDKREPYSGPLVLWDGHTMAGKAVPAGTYFVAVGFTGTESRRHQLKLSVTLLR